MASGRWIEHGVPHPSGSRSDSSEARYRTWPTGVLSLAGWKEHLREPICRHHLVMVRFTREMGLARAK